MTISMKEYLQQSARTAAVCGNLTKKAVDENGHTICNGTLDNNFKISRLLHNTFHNSGQISNSLKRTFFYGEPLEKTLKKSQESITEQEALYALLTETSKSAVTDLEFNPSEIDLIHACLGISSEVLELYSGMIKGKLSGNVDKVNLREELGDILWYVALALRALDTDFETEANRNIEKLKTRYAEKFTTEEAVNRDLQAERETLENK